MKRITIFTILLSSVLLFSAATLQAQSSINDVHLFQSYFFDTPIAADPYAEAGFEFDSYNALSDFIIGARGGYAVNEQIEVEAQLGFISRSWDSDLIDGSSGLTDLNLYGRYRFDDIDDAAVSAGAMLSLPIGSKDVGNGNLNFGAFGATRYPLENGMVITGNLGLMFFETKEYGEGTITQIVYDPATGQYTGGEYIPGEEKTKYESYVNIGLGTIYPVNEKLNAVGELAIHSKGSYSMLSVGADYGLGNGRVRGMLGIGLDDGAPDLAILGTYAITL